MLFTLVHLRPQLPHAALAELYGVTRPTVTRAVHEIRPLLAGRGFAVPQRLGARPHTLADVFAHAEAEGVDLRVDGTEVQVRRPRAGRARRTAFVSGKKRQNTAKTTTISDSSGRLLWSGAGRPGRMHDRTAVRTESIAEQLRLHPEGESRGRRGLPRTGRRVLRPGQRGAGRGPFLPGHRPVGTHRPAGCPHPPGHPPPRPARHPAPASPPLARVPRDDGQIVGDRGGHGRTQHGDQLSQSGRQVGPCAAAHVCGSWCVSRCYEGGSSAACVAAVSRSSHASSVRSVTVQRAADTTSSGVRKPATTQATLGSRSGNRRAA